MKKFLIILLILLIVGGSAAGVFIYRKNSVSADNSITNTSEIEQENEELKTLVKQLTKDLYENDKTNTQLKNENTELNNQIENLKAENSTLKEDVEILETENNKLFASTINNNVLYGYWATNDEIPEQLNFLYNAFKVTNDNTIIFNAEDVEPIPFTFNSSGISISLDGFINGFDIDLKNETMKYTYPIDGEDVTITYHKAEIQMSGIDNESYVGLWDFEGIVYSFCPNETVYMHVLDTNTSWYYGSHYTRSDDTEVWIITVILGENEEYRFDYDSINDKFTNTNLNWRGKRLSSILVDNRIYHISHLQYILEI